MGTDQENIDKTLNNSKDQNETQEIYVYMACISYNAEIPRRYFGDSSQLTNWILESFANYYMKPDILDFIPVPLVETEKY